MKTAVAEYLDIIRQHDYNTFLHCVKTAELAAYISKHLGISANEIYHLRIAAVLHDLGKINISCQILHSSNKLNDKEWILVKKHPVDGANIIQRSLSDKNIVEGILLHHERYDGAGYPSHLKGEEIPWQARVIAVADSLEAMTAFRYYKKAKTFNEALQELYNMSEKHFDPYIIKKLPQWDHTALNNILYSFE